MNMSLASPSWLWLGLAAIPIIAFYLLRIQPRRYEVSTLIFWDNVIQETKRRAWWQSLRRWLSLLLQLAFLFLLVAAMVDPIFGRSEQARDIVVVIDRSASMNAPLAASGGAAASSGQTRLDAALQRAKSLANGLRGGDTMAVITAGGAVEVVAGRGDFGPSIIEAIDAVRPTDGPSNIAEAIQLARRIAPEEERRQIIVLSDQVAEKIAPDAETETRATNAAAADEGKTDLFYETQGTSRSNWAITSLAVRRSLADPVGYSVRGTVQRFLDPENAELEQPPPRLKLSLVSFQSLDEAAAADAAESGWEPLGELVDVLPIKVDPSDDNSFVWTTEATSAAGGVLVAEIDFAEEASFDDAIAADNIARAVVPARPNVPVRIVTDETIASTITTATDTSESDTATPKTDAGLFFLRSVLRSIPTLQLIESDQSLPPGGLTVWYRLEESPGRLPEGPLLVLSPPAVGPPVAGPSTAPAWSIAESIKTPIVAKTSESSPLMRHVQLTNVTLGASNAVSVAESFGITEPLIQTAGDETVAIAVERTGDAAGSRVLILATDLGSSDFPLRIAFPVMMTNAVNWFTGRDAECPSPLRAGVPGRTRVVGRPGLRLLGDRVSVAAHSRGAIEKSTLVPMSNGAASLPSIARVGLARVTMPSVASAELGSLAEAATGPAAEAKVGSPEGQPKAPMASEELTATRETAGWVAINLCDPVESDTRIAETPESSKSETAVSFVRGSSPWFFLVMVGLALIVTEWGLFQRRIVE
jgi:hypothetical protein